MVPSSTRINSVTMKWIYLIVGVILFNANLHAQRFDNTWLLGYNQNNVPGDIYGISVMTFDQGSAIFGENLITSIEFWPTTPPFPTLRVNCTPIATASKSKTPTFKLWKTVANLTRLFLRGRWKHSIIRTTI